MSLKDVVIEINRARAEASYDPTDAGYSARAGADALIRNAKDRLPGLEDQYYHALSGSILVISVTGAGSQKFAEFARDLKVPAFDHKQVVTDIMAELTRKRVGETLGTNEANALLAIMFDIKNKMRVSAMLPLDLAGTLPPVYGTQLADAVSRAVIHTYGSSLYDLYTLRAAQKAALEARFDGKVFPVLVYNHEDMPGAETFLPKPMFHIVANEDVTIDFAKKELLRVKNSLKKPSKAGTITNEGADSKNETETQN